MVKNTKSSMPGILEQIRHLYWDEHLNQEEIQRKLNLTSICYLMNKYNIPTRSSVRPDIDETILRRLYCDNRLNCSQIGKLLKVHGTTIRNKLKIFKIPMRTLSEDKKLLKARYPDWVNYNYIGKSKSNNYITVYKPDHPAANYKKCVFEHRLVMESILGRYLTEKEVVHHIGVRYPLGSIENKQDNNEDNLCLFSSESEHEKFHNRLRRLNKIKL
jgi:hypothetical protein